MRPLQIPDEHLQAIVNRALIGNPATGEPATSTPDAADLINLYLFLPTVVTTQRGCRLEVRSALTSLLVECHEVTGRDVNGDVVDESKLGALLGAVGYLALIDQAGKAVRWKDRPPTGSTSFENILAQHRISADDASALYALRNALVHSYALTNQNSNRSELQRTFVLVPTGHLVEHPERPWGGDPNNVQGQETTVSLQAVGELAQNLVLDLTESWVRNMELELSSGLTPEWLRRKYVYTRDVSKEI